MAIPRSKETSDDKGGSQTVRAQLALRDLVLSGEARPGERLSELAIVEKFGVSRTPARAALALLAEEGLLEALPSGGYGVRVFSDRDVADAIEVRGMVEGLAARLAAERGVSARACDPARDLIARMDEALQSQDFPESAFRQYVDLNARFHREIIALADSSVVDRQLARIMALPFASPSAFVMAQSRMAEAHQSLIIAQDHHRCIVEAIETREGARAEALMREHSRLAGRNLKAALRSKPVMELVSGAALIQTRAG